MKHWISLVNTTEVEQFVDIAKAADDFGFEGITVPDHLLYPQHIETKYPYTADGKTWWPDTNPWPDPWVTLTAMGAATQNLKLASNIYLAALRDPFTVARAVGAAAIFTNNRVRCGVSAGWLKEEFDIAGVDFSSRGRRLDEVIDCMHKLHSGNAVSHNGEFFKYEAVIVSPAPSQKIPVWVGGASRAALKRSARNDGWLGVPMPNSDLAEVVNNLFELRKGIGNYDKPFDVVLSATEVITPEFIGSLDKQGRYHCSTLPWTPSPWGRAAWVKEGEDHKALSTKLKAMERYRAMMEQMGTWE